MNDHECAIGPIPGKLRLNHPCYVHSQEITACANARLKQVKQERERCAKIAEEMTMNRDVEETRGHVRVSLISEKILEG